jgi:hypothetical protein
MNLILCSKVPYGKKKLPHRKKIPTRLQSKIHVISFVPRGVGFSVLKD